MISAAAVAAVAAIAAQTPAEPPRDLQRRFRSGVDLVAVGATVTDRDGHLITGLGRDQFEIYEDGVRQTLAVFTNERVPIGLGVLLDISDSMFGRRIADARSAVSRFLFELLQPQDEFFVFAFNHRPRPLTGWTRAAGEVQRALDALRPSGGTAAYDAIVDALPLIEARSRERGALVVISDGADTASTATLRDVRAALLRSDALVYAIAIDPPGAGAINARVDAQALREITAESGGSTEIVQSSADLDTATARIAEELNSQYLLGYTPTHPADGKYHSLRVRVTGSASDLRVRARNGYVTVR